ncbi:MAG: hypothetical protein WC876_01875 [Candidatus Thermoplasmatota archaeon]|jgi:hypothetical protein
MKVPVYDNADAATRPVGFQPSNLNFENGLGAAAQGLGQLSRGVEHVVSVEETKAKAAKEEAAATAEAIAATDAERRWGIRAKGDPNNPKAPPGVLQLRGMDAVNASGDVITKFEDDLEEASKWVPEERRSKFKQRMTPRLLGMQERVTDHSNSERHTAAVSAEAGLADRLLSEIPDKPTPAFLEEQAAQLEQTVRPLQLSPEEGDMKMRRWKERAALDAMRAHMATAEEDPVSADIALNGTNRALGFKQYLGPEVVAALQEKIDSYKGDAVVLGGARLSAAMSRDAEAADPLIDGEGWMREGAALENARSFAEQNGLTPKQDEALQGRTLLEVRRNLQAKKEKYEAVSDGIYQTINERGWWGTSEADKKTLNKVNPPLYRALENEAVRESKADRQSKTQNDREQAAIDRFAKSEYRKQLAEGGYDPKENTDQAWWAVGASPDVKNDIKTMKAKHGKVVDAGAEKHLNEGRRDVRAMLPPITKKGKNDKQYAANVNEQENRADVAYESLYYADLEANKKTNPADPKPTHEQMVVIKARAVLAGGSVDYARGMAYGQLTAPKPSPGARKRDRNGVLWERMPDGSARQVKE